MARALPCASTARRQLSLPLRLPRVSAGDTGASPEMGAASPNSLLSRRKRLLDSRALPAVSTSTQMARPFPLGSTATAGGRARVPSAAERGNTADQAGDTEKRNAAQT